ncbi:hypothetical protein [Paraburkholderia caribensis]|nr:hypothetical protein [Paraburkholderia caribensis]
MDAPSLVVDSRANCLTLGFEIVDDLGAHVERPKLAAHCVMQSAWTLESHTVAIGSARPDADFRSAPEQTFRETNEYKKFSAFPSYKQLE